MALITDLPEDLPSTNALDYLDDPDDELDEDGLSIDRYLAFGTTPKAIPRPPKDGEVVTYQVKVECVGQAHKRRADGEMRYKSELTILSVARTGEELPADYTPEPTAAQKRKAEKEAAEQAKAEQAKAEQDENQPPMFDDTGELAQAIADSEDAGAEDQDAGTDEDTGRPPFSDGAK